MQCAAEFGATGVPGSGSKIAVELKRLLVTSGVVPGAGGDDGIAVFFPAADT
jgi:hypothetical protein